jgi:hypothetical protein
MISGGILIGGTNIMASKDATSLAADKSITMPNFSLGQEQTEAAAALQKELLEALRASQSCLACSRTVGGSPVVRASTKLTATRSVPEAFEAYTKCVTKRMQMTAESIQRLPTDYAKNHQVVDEGVALRKHVRTHHAHPLSG